MEEKTYIQTLNGNVNMVGGKELGFLIKSDGTIDEELHKSHPNVRTFYAENYDPMPEIGMVYNEETDSFDWPEPVEPEPVKPEISNEQIIHGLSFNQMQLFTIMESQGMTIEPAQGAQMATMSTQGRTAQTTQIPERSKYFNHIRHQYLLNETNDYTIETIAIPNGLITQEEFEDIKKESEADVFEPDEEYPEWFQPDGSAEKPFDSWPPDSRTTHNRHHWVNTLEINNVWEPGIYGWALISGLMEEE